MNKDTYDRADLTARAVRSASSVPRPFVRWAGSKRGSLSHLIPHLPSEFGTYFEPFLGGGALFFLLRPKKALLNDACVELVEAYRAIRSDAARVADAATRHPMSESSFYHLRANRSDDPWERAGEFLYLNRGCFNGLYRVNSQGLFNVPWGRPKSSFVVDPENLLAVQELLSQEGIFLTCEDFARCLTKCKSGDFVYLDPPYVTTHNNNGFVEYNERLFGWQDQVRLACAAEELRLRGCYVLVTNALHEDVLQLYRNFEVHQLTRSSTLAGSSAKRGKVSEAVLVGKPA